MRFYVKPWAIAAQLFVARGIEEFNHDRPHRGVGNRTPHEAFLDFAVPAKRGPGS